MGYPGVSGPQVAASPRFPVAAGRCPRGAGPGLGVPALREPVRGGGSRCRALPAAVPRCPAPPPQTRSAPVPPCAHSACSRSRRAVSQPPPARPVLVRRLPGHTARLTRARPRGSSSPRAAAAPPRLCGSSNDMAARSRSANSAGSAALACRTAASTR